MPDPTILTTRSFVKKGAYALIPPDAPVTNLIPEMPECRVKILASPELGAAFVQYWLEAAPGKGTVYPLAAENGIETFFFLLEGTCTLSFCGQTVQAQPGVFLYCSPLDSFRFTCTGDRPMKALLYKQRYQPLKGVAAPHSFCSNAAALPPEEGGSILTRKLIPSDLSFDFQMNLLTFVPGNAHTFVETHLQEHSICFLEGKCVYLIGEEWKMVKKDDFLWFGPYTPQACYNLDGERFSYLLSKDCNRDAVLEKEG